MSLITVANFLAYVNSGFYDGTIFHRVIDNFMVQGGGFTKELQQKPTRAAIVNESRNGLSNVRGSVAMARTGDLPHLFAALAAEGIAPKTIPMRGGTDGAALSARGLPTPNYFTGASNFHSRFEFLPVPAFAASYRVTRRICGLAAGEGGVDSGPK